MDFLRLRYRWLRGRGEKETTQWGIKEGDDISQKNLTERNLKTRIANSSSGQGTRGSDAGMP